MFTRLTLTQKIAIGFGVVALSVILNSMMMIAYVNKSYHMNVKLISAISLEKGEAGKSPTQGSRLTEKDYLKAIADMNNRIKMMMFSLSVITLFILVLIGFSIVRSLVMNNAVKPDEGIQGDNAAKPFKDTFEVPPHAEKHAGS